MNQRYILFQRSGVYYCEDRETRKQTSLRTRDKAEAHTLLHAKNESTRQPILNLRMARVYLAASDPQVATRTWQTVMDEIIRTKTGANQDRWKASAKSKQFDVLRSRVLIETQPEHLLHVLQEGTVTTNVYLRRMHNFALDMNWLPASIIPKRQWPPVCYKEKRAITFDEHQQIIERERNLFDHDRSASRGTMSPQKLVVFKHQSALGNAPAHKLFERVTVQRKSSVPVGRSFSEYDVTVNKSGLPSGIELNEML